MARIQILLATYNGGKYLREQLNSLLGQTGQDFDLEILIRDDGSTDHTPQIIQEYRDRHPGTIRLIRDMPGSTASNENLGIAGNFSRLLEASDAPYVMFCDQDDRWRPQKTALTFMKMRDMEQRYGAGEPLLVHTDMGVCDDRLNLVAPSFNREYHAHKKTQDLSRLIRKNNITGMTMMLNHAMREKVGKVPDMPGMVHDYWTSLVATVTGHVGYINQPLADYRLHDGNASGIHPKPHGMERVKGKLHRLLLGWKTNDEDQARRRERQERAVATAEVLMQRFGGEIDEESKNLLRKQIDPLFAKGASVMMHYPPVGKSNSRPGKPPPGAKGFDLSGRG